ncbi:MAG: Ig-like domain-containing protein, partial [Bacillota bacterium]|nr:Ig-like domain-containing protein [Bacillota bacterium]
CAVNTPGRYVLPGRAVDDRTKTFRLTLTVTKVPVTSVRWLDPELRLPVGTTTPVGSVAEVLPKDATHPELKYEILQGRDLVEFDPATGLIKGVKPGVAKIKATSVDDPKLSDTLTIRVFVPLPVTNGLALHLDALEFDTSFLIDPRGMGGAIKGWNDISGNAHHFYRSVQEKNVPQFVADPTVPSVRLREGPLEGAIPTILLAKKKDVMPNRPTVIFIVSKQNTDEFELISQYELESDNDRERLVSFGQERNNGTNLKVFLDDTGQTQSTEPTAAQTIHLDVVSFIPQADGRTIDITWNRRYGSALSLNHSFRYDKSALEDVDASSTSFFRLGGTNTTQSDFYEVIIFDNGLTTAETDQIINYLKTKWNF